MDRKLLSLLPIPKRITILNPMVRGKKRLETNTIQAR